MQIKIRAIIIIFTFSGELAYLVRLLFNRTGGATQRKHGGVGKERGCGAGRGEECVVGGQRPCTRDTTRRLAGRDKVLHCCHFQQTLPPIRYPPSPWRFLEKSGRPPMLANEPSLNCGVFAHSRKRHVCSSTAFQFFISASRDQSTAAYHRETSSPAIHGNVCTRVRPRCVLGKHGRHAILFAKLLCWRYFGVYFRTGADE